MYVLQLAAIFQWATRQSSDVENQIVSVERIMEVSTSSPLLSFSLNFLPVSSCVLSGFENVLRVPFGHIYVSGFLPPFSIASFPQKLRLTLPLGERHDRRGLRQAPS